MRGEHNYFVYFMTNEWKDALYVGVTSALEARVWQHKNGTFPGFTKKYNCHTLVYYEQSNRIESAISREKEIKGWRRSKKNALVATMNPTWKDLAADWYTPLPR